MYSVLAFYRCDEGVSRSQAPTRLGHHREDICFTAYKATGLSRADPDQKHKPRSIRSWAVSKIGRGVARRTRASHRPQFLHHGCSGRLNYTGTAGQFNSEDLQGLRVDPIIIILMGQIAASVVPRRPSPLQAHSQASPLGHAQSPAYPMYNSPMNSISSPQQSSSNQVAPPSPLDVSVPRPSSQTGNVAYPSVITRALNPDKNFPERYERPNHNNQQNQNCWDERQGQGQLGGSQSNNYNSNSSIEMNRGEQNQQRVVIGVGERQQSYFETKQWTPGHIAGFI
ncbi:hypothetical protein NQ318_017697 [Aromia moschata]|uniref:Uncharacterized protein n=1 Tax=Aromia moschata TaxID=1265417 RepID=A0AAV8Y0E2_9CUCU|nr:hypothetical protein NQ318_017697 [Aromia moschata]